MWLAALITGLAGSLHCAGMCGPIALSLPLPEGANKFSLYFGRALYNFGRIASYAVMGAVMGSIGSAIGWFGWQQYLSIAAGIVILLFALGHKFKLGQLGLFRGPVQEFFSRNFTRLMHSPVTGSMLTLGLLNGFLPCGLVYIALAGAVASGNALQGSLYMVVFGLGTFPVMYVLSLGNAWLSLKNRMTFRRVVPYLAAFIGILFIVRGLNLGIPYLSPKISDPQQEVPECCHPSE